MQPPLGKSRPKFIIPNETYVDANEATKHITFAPVMFCSSGILAYTTNVEMGKIKDVK